MHNACSCCRPETALPVFRQAGDFRCVTRTLLELAGQHRPGQPAAAAGLLLQALDTALLAGGGPLRAQVLARLAAAAAEAGDLPLAARALGALDALEPPAGGTSAAADVRAALPADQARVLQGAACAGCLAEGLAGGISLILATYPRYPR